MENTAASRIDTLRNPAANYPQSDRPDAAAAESEDGVELP